MTHLKFEGDITLDEVFENSRGIIYDRVVKAIEENYQSQEISEIKVIEIEINNTQYTINLSREKFISGLTNAINFYEREEMYEKCQHCLDIINQLEKKNLEEAK